MLFWIIAIALVALLAYVRFAPVEAAQWHSAAPGDALGETRGANSLICRAPYEEGLLQSLDEVIRKTPRTEVVAGSLADGQITYVTRTALVGYPDFTTIGTYGDDPRYVEIYARSRFGKSDLGVNAKRVEGWLTEIKAR